MPDFLELINKASPAHVDDILEGIVERSPWVIAGVHEHRPFSDLDDLKAVVEDCLRKLSDKDRQRLARAHPELAGREATTLDLTDGSFREQGQFDMMSLSAPDKEKMDCLNAEYRAKFGFPFIIALKEQPDLQTVFRVFEKRLAATSAEEIVAALQATIVVVRDRIDRMDREYTPEFHFGTLG